MENQTNLGNKNTQQIGQNSVSQLAVNPEKPKTNYFMIGGIVFACFVVFGFGGYYLGMRTSTKQKYTNQNQPVPTNSPETTLIQPSSISFRLEAIPKSAGVKFSRRRCSWYSRPKWKS